MCVREKTERLKCRIMNATLLFSTTAQYKYHSINIIGKTIFGICLNEILFPLAKNVYHFNLRKKLYKRLLLLRI